MNDVKGYLVAAVLVVALVVPSFLYAHGDEAPNEPGHEGHGGLVHPFLVHMGLPDEPGMTDVRINSVQSIENGVRSGDVGFHIEAGLWKGVGIHLRNDGMSENPETELMVQGDLWRDSTKQSGIAIFGEAAFPTGESAANEMNWLYGVSGRFVFSHFSLDADIHHNIRDKMVEFEAGLVCGLTPTIFPILEMNGEFQQNASALVNLMPAVKIKLGGNNVVGIGYKFPLSSRKEFERQLVVQWDMDFHN